MPSSTLPGSLVSAAWLAEQLENPRLVVLDASWKPVAMAATQEERGVGEQIPGAQLFDFDKKICDLASPLPHMMPAPAEFEQEVRRLGVHQDSLIVVYDRVGVYSSPRVWWMLKAMGHDQVAVLDGGLPAWIAAGLPREPAGARTAAAGNFLAKPRPELFCTADQVAAVMADERHALLDARSAGRFLGLEPEPRPGLRGGHIPHARNLPFDRVQTQGHMRPAGELRALLAPLASHEQRLICSCGSGVTASLLALAATLADYPAISVYDGSWSEWGLPSSRPVVTAADNT